MHIISTILVFVLCETVAESSKILVIFPLPIKSHVVAYQPLMEELAARGHEMTVVTPFPRAKPLANYTELIYEDTFPSRDTMNLFQYERGGMLRTLFFLSDTFIESCHKLVKQPILQKLLHTKDLEFDLIIYEPFGSQCTYGLLHKFQSPSIQMIPNTLIPWMGNSLGNPSTLSYIPDITSHNDLINFQNRLVSVLRMFPLSIINLYIEYKLTKIMRENSPDISIPSVSELQNNASFLFIHTHPIINYPRPLNPNTIEVGGLHIKVTQKLPQDLKKYLDDAPHGVIYFSLGSNVRGVDMPEKMRNGILKSFSKLKQKVLWKWEADKMSGQPKNVRLSKWLPQHDVLAHPNIKLFITHGGLLSIEEATYFGIPMIAIPVMGDQKFNAYHAQNSGYAIVLEVQNITEKSLDWAIQEMLHEPRYWEKAQQLSKIFQDQPQKSLDRAIYWIEYAIRHKGAQHLRSAAIELNFFQYYLLDVIAVLLLVLLISVLLIIQVGKQIIKIVFFKNYKVDENKKRN